MVRYTVTVILVPPDFPHTVRIVHRKFLVLYRASFKLNEVKNGTDGNWLTKQV